MTVFITIKDVLAHIEDCGECQTNISLGRKSFIASLALDNSPNRNLVNGARHTVTEIHKSQ